MMKIDESIFRAAIYWGLKVHQIRRDIEISGSPERCELRFVIECDNGRLYTLESIFEEDISHKQRIINCLNFLSAQKTGGITPYLCSVNQKFIIRHDNRFWQMIPYIQGVILDRPGYVFDKWRGNILAKFLLDLKQNADNIPFGDNAPRFSIRNYIYTLTNQIRLHDPDRIIDFNQSIKFLEYGLKAWEPLLPQRHQLIVVY